MLLSAITKDQYKWINYVWAFHKNYYEYNEKKDKKKEDKGDDDEENNNDNDQVIIVNGEKVQNVDLKELFRLIIQVYTKEGNLKVKQEIQKCCEWKLDFSPDTHNVFKSSPKQDQGQE